MKRFWKLLTVALLVCAMGLNALPAAALSTEAVDSLVVLGDSISTGYGLTGDLYTRASYANLVASAMGVSAENGYTNYAVDGYTSAQILQKAKDNETTVAAADMIMMTNGGNDVMWKMLEIAMEAVGVTELDMTQMAIAMMMTDAATMNAKLYSEQNLATIAAAIENYRVNLTATMEYLHTVNPDARVLVLTQYNPASGLTSFGALYAYVETVIGQLNTSMTEVVTAAGYEIVDTHAVMEGQGATLSNIMSGDIHPNALGHAKMAEMVKSYLGLVEPVETEPEQTTTAEPLETTPVPEETTTKPAVTTSEPEETSTEPAVTTAEPEETTTPGTSATTAVTTTPAATTTTAEPVTTAGTSATETEPDPETEPEAGITATTSETPSDTAGNTEQPPADEDDKQAAPTAVIVGGALIGVGVIALIVAVCVRKKH